MPDMDIFTLLELNGKNMKAKLYIFWLGIQVQVHETDFDGHEIDFAPFS